MRVSIWAYGAASMMRPLLFSATLLLTCSRLPAIAEAIPREKAGLIRTVLSRSILSQSNVNLRGSQTELVQISSGTQISHKRYTRSREGKALAVVTDSRGNTTGAMGDDGYWNKAYDSRTRTLTVTRSMRVPTDSASVSARVLRILTSYRVQYLGADVMAARTCHKLLLDPYDVSGRPIKVWIDVHTGVTLGREESDRRGNFIGMTIFRSIEYLKELPASAVTVIVPKNTRVIRVSRSPLFKSPGALKAWAKIDILQPISMPRGFEFETGELLSLAGVPTVCLRYSDGLAVITVFQTQTSKSSNGRYQSVAHQLLPRGESVAVSGQTEVTSVVIGPRESDGIVMVARALDRQRERIALQDLLLHYAKDEQHVRRLRSEGYGLDSIVGLLEICGTSGRKLDDLVKLKKQGWTWNQIALRFRISPESIAPLVRQYECR